MDNKETLNIDVWNEEQQLKETVYTHLTNEKNDRAVRVKAAQKYVESGSYESQDAFKVLNYYDRNFVLEIEKMNY